MQVYASRTLRARRLATRGDETTIDPIDVCSCAALTLVPRVDALFGNPTRFACVALSGVALAAAGCAKDAPTGFGADCTDEVHVSATPGDTTLTVGQQYTAHVALSTCGGKFPITAALTWSAGDSVVAKVDAVTGVVTALSPGKSQIFASTLTNDRYSAGTVTVR